LGPQGLYEIGYQAIQKASYMKQQLIDSKFTVSNSNNSLREFILQTTKPAKEVVLEMGAKGFLAGIKYSENEILVAVTEKRTKEEIDSYVNSLLEVDHV
jgi:glycine dehydrogenase subunit 1